MPQWIIPDEELFEEFVRSAVGPGGQHVNRTETTVRLHYRYAQSEVLNADAKARLLVLAAPFLQGGEIVLQCRESRSLARNREMAREKLESLLTAASVVPKKRKKTKPTRASKERRLSAKTRRSELKRNRSKSDFY